MKGHHMGSTERRGAIYVRVSGRVQEQEGTSLDTQEAACRTYSERQGIHVETHHIYREVHSGAELWERPALTSLLTAMRAGEFDVIVAYAVDRLSREQHHLGLIVSEAERHGAALNSPRRSGTRHHKASSCGV